MTAFPVHDPYWAAAADFVEEHRAEGERIMGPRVFRQRFPDKFDDFSRAEEMAFQWAIIHKGRTTEVGYRALRRVTRDFRPVFANEVFVIFARRRDLPAVPSRSPHMISFSRQFRTVRRLISAAKRRLRRIVNPTGRFPFGPPSAVEQWSSLSPEEIRRRMNESYSSGTAYQITTLWDDVRTEEMQEVFAELVSKGRVMKNTRVLDVGCGNGGMAPALSGCKEYIGVELSEVAVEKARAEFGRPNVRFRQMDATELDFADSYFDVVVAREFIEHLPKPERFLPEAWRVLKPDGCMVLSSPNRDSLHLRVNRMLGHPDFVCCFEHVKEYTYAEMREMLEKARFRISEERGVFFMPYWGIPVVDGPVRALTDNDPEMVAMLRELGRRVGPEYSFCYIFRCAKLMT